LDQFFGSKYSLWSLNHLPAAIQEKCAPLLFGLPAVGGYSDAVLDHSAIRLGVFGKHFRLPTPLQDGRTHKLFDCSTMLLVCALGLIQRGSLQKNGLSPCASLPVFFSELPSLFCEFHRIQTGHPECNTFG
jgi:hypothetical protein